MNDQRGSLEQDTEVNDSVATASTKRDTSPSGGSKNSFLKHMPTPDMLAKGIATGVAVSTITQTGRKVMSALVKNPIVMFAAGFAAGYFVHKYRKQIIATASSAAEQSKDFVLRQRENLGDLLAETQEEADEAGSQG